MKKPKPKIARFGSLRSVKEKKSDGTYVSYEHPTIYKPLGDKIEVMLSTDHRAPGVILPVFYFKKPYEKVYPDIWEQINELWLDPYIYHYGIRHADNDYLCPFEIASARFITDRYGVLFTNTNLRITSREAAVTIFMEIALKNYEIITTPERRLRKLIEHCEECVEKWKETQRR
jgi:hypothetical protein